MISWSGFSATSGSRLFINIRIAASWCQLLQLSSLPRGARTVRARRGTSPSDWRTGLADRLSLIPRRIYPHESVRPLARCRQTTRDRSLSGARLLVRVQTRAQRPYPHATDADALAPPRRRAVRSPKDSRQDRQSTAV